MIAPYSATGAEQLTLAPGQLILIRKKNPGGWWEGELQVRHHNSKYEKKQQEFREAIRCQPREKKQFYEIIFTLKCSQYNAIVFM